MHGKFSPPPFDQVTSLWAHIVSGFHACPLVHTCVAGRCAKQPLKWKCEGNPVHPGRTGHRQQHNPRISGRALIPFIHLTTPTPGNPSNITPPKPPITWSQCTGLFGWISKEVDCTTTAASTGGVLLMTTSTGVTLSEGASPRHRSCQSVFRCGMSPRRRCTSSCKVAVLISRQLPPSGYTLLNSVLLYLLFFFFLTAGLLKSNNPSLSLLPFCVSCTVFLLLPPPPHRTSGPFIGG